MSRPFPHADLELVLEHTRPLWGRVGRGARFFVTGASGFVGRWMIESLLHASDRLGLDVEVTALTRDRPRFLLRAPHLAARATVHTLEADVTAIPDPGPDRYDYILHAAAETGPEPDALHEGTMRVLDLAVHQPTRGLLYLSSGAVYGQHSGPIPEDTPLGPTTAYARGKVNGEDLCRWYAEEQGLRCHLARLFAFIGPQLPLHAHYAAGNFLRDALRGGPIRVTGDGTPLRSWLHAADMAAWLWTILLAGQVARPYNVGSDYACSIAGLARTVATISSNAPLDVTIEGPYRADVRPHRYLPDTTRAQTELGLHTWTPLPEAIRRTLDWHRRVL